MKLCFVNTEESKYVDKKLSQDWGSFCRLFLWITLGMSRFRRVYTCLKEEKHKTAQVTTSSLITYLCIFINLYVVLFFASWMQIILFYKAMVYQRYIYFIQKYVLSSPSWMWLVQSSFLELGCVRILSNNDAIYKCFFGLTWNYFWGISRFGKKFGN